MPTAEGDDIVGFERVHLEEDAAKTMHEGGGGGRLAGSHGAVVDFNRCGTPLMEMVTRPDLRTPEQASRFAAFLRETIVALGVSECDMEKGSLRVDANVSLRRPGETELTHEDRAQEHELVQLPRARHRARAAPPGRDVRRRRAGHDRRRCTTTRAATS